uniref:UBC core domain-containing protein n=1 Tax=Ditylenchus dipsaci TaxID=166011 RepID=A0A915EKM1_9BILA
MSEIDVETMRTDKIKAMAEQSHLCNELVEQIANDSPIIALLDYHLNNDSVFDISCHIDFYQALLELATGLSFIPAFLPYLVLPKNEKSKSISRELIPRFRDILNTYPLTIRGHASPDLSLMDFIRKTNDLSDIILKMSRQFEKSLPERRVVVTEVAKDIARKASLASTKTGQLVVQSLPRTLATEYTDLLRPYQINTHRILNDANKPIFGFTFKKELRNVNPFSSSHKDRTKRIAKELASMHSSLPLNASNSIFVCMDETRCDMLKVLISGPDGTPYQNGLFEFDVFFPTNYPHQPPKCSFLTTGAGAVRFNPNLYNDGKICISILGTWDGRPEEKWNSFCSLLQVLVSIQGLIFSSQPYFNEPGFEKFQGTLKGDDFSRKYNLHIENATLIYAIMEQYENAPPYFKDAEKWLQEVAREIQSNANDPIDQENSVMEGMFVSPMVQRQRVRNLIEEFRNMKNPMEQ